MSMAKKNESYVKLNKYLTKLEKCSSKMYDALDNIEVRKFSGKLDRIVNAILSVVSTAAIVLLTFYNIELLNIANWIDGLFGTVVGTIENAKSWGILIGGLFLSTYISRGKVKLFKWLKKITVRPGLTIIIMVMCEIPNAVANNVLSQEVMYLVVFGCILYSCFAARASLYNVFISSGAKGLNKGMNVLAQESVNNGTDSNADKNFAKMWKNLFANIIGANGSAAKKATTLLVVLAIAFTVAWIYLSPIYSTKVISIILVLSLVTIFELVEAFSVISTKDDTIDISTQRVQKLYDDMKNTFALKSSVA